MKIRLKSLKNRGVCLLETLLLFLLVLLAAGFVFYLGVKIVDLIKAILAKRDREQQQLLPEEGNSNRVENASSKPIRVEFLGSQFFQEKG